jgi:hypothetical protein
MSSPELARIRADLARAKQRVHELETGKRGVKLPSGDFGGDQTQAAFNARNPHMGQALDNQLQAQRLAVARFELEYVNAMIPHPWTPSKVIEAMSHVCPTPAPEVREVEKIVEREVPVEKIVERAVAATDADVMTKLRELIARIPSDATVASLKELIQ